MFSTPSGARLRFIPQVHSPPHPFPLLHMPFPALILYPPPLPRPLLLSPPPAPALPTNTNPLIPHFSPHSPSPLLSPPPSSFLPTGTTTSFSTPFLASCSTSGYRSSRTSRCLPSPALPHLPPRPPPLSPPPNNHRDDYIILNALLGFVFHEWVPLFQNFAPCTASGLLITLLMHVGPAEFLYYWLHRALHHHTLYSKYHSHHHASFLTEPVTGTRFAIGVVLNRMITTTPLRPCVPFPLSPAPPFYPRDNHTPAFTLAATVHPFMEHLMYAAVFVVPFYASCLLGCASVGGVYAYMLAFDALNFMGHCNFEFFPASLFRALPFLKYLIYTPS
ncbi:unnamed protein product [Closterium sp. NIES-54]